VKEDGAAIRYMDPVSEHRPWCAWVAAYGRDSGVTVSTGDGAAIGDRKSDICQVVPAGWQRLLVYLLPKVSRAKPIAKVQICNIKLWSTFIR
jgi:hypothetical protein